MDRGPRDGAHGEKPVAERDRHEDERGEVVHGELQLDSIRRFPPLGADDGGVVEQDTQPTLPRVQLPCQLANGGLGGEIGDARLHDLRRSFATYHGEIGTAPEILSALLNHAPVGMTAKVYNRAENIQPKRQAMERWCDFLQLVLAGEFEAAKKMQGADIVSLTEVA